MSIQTDSDNSFLLFIRSKEAEQITSGVNSNMRIDLSAGIGRNNANQDIHIQLSSCEIPHSFYNVSNNLENSSLVVNGSADLLFVEKHYNIDELIDAINSGGSGSVSIGLTASFEEQSAKVTLANSSGSTMTINFGTSKGFAKLIGFPEEDFIINNSSSRQGFNVVNMNSIHSLFVHTNLSVANVITTTNNNFRNILQKIPVNNQFGEIINYNPYLSSQFSSVVNTNEIKSLEISIRDQNDILVDFNNINFEISVLFEIHQRDTIPIPLPIAPTRRSDRDFENTNTTPSTVSTISNTTPSIPNTSPLESIPISQLGQYSQPTVSQEIPIPVSVSKKEEDNLLSDKFNHKIQKELIDDILEDLI